MEDKPNSVLKISDTRAAIFETFNKLRKWREDQVQQFQNMQLLESKKILQQSQENQKHFEQLLEHNKEKNLGLLPNNFSPVSSEKNESDSSLSLQESSITSHFLRCFDDTCASTPSINGGMGDFNYAKSTATSSGEVQSLNEFLQLKCQEKENSGGKDDAVILHDIKPKRAFLKKGSGLLRYMPKSAQNGERVKPKKVPLPQKKPNYPRVQKTLKLKPFVSSAEEFSKPVKHVQFSEVSLQRSGNGSPNMPSCSSKTEVPQEVLQSFFIDVKDDAGQCMSETQQSSERPECDSNEYLESKELAEFEILESCAQNSSFNSDSSIVQRVLHGEPIRQSKPAHFDDAMKTQHVFSVFLDNEKTSARTDDILGKSDFNKCLEEVQTRKQQLQQMILDMNPRILSLEKEISEPNKDRYEQENIEARKQQLHQIILDINPRIESLEKKISESNKDRCEQERERCEQERERCEQERERCDRNDRCRTPSDCTDLQDILLNYASGNNSDNESSVDTIIPAKSDFSGSVFESNCDCCAVKNIPSGDCCSHEFGDFQNEKPPADENHQNDASQVPVEKSKIREKLIELEKEIEIYQEQNAKLLAIRKEREEIVKKLKKESEDFQKYKEEEKKKLEKEIENERRQIKRQKETFLRFQKLRQDNPSRKEREELSTLRLEVEKLQEELKRQKIKNNNDTKRLKNLLVAAEKERDTFKLENIRLEDQCQDLLSALKARNRKWKSEILRKSDAGEKEPCKCSLEKDLKISVPGNVAAKESGDVTAKESEEHLVPMDHSTDNINGSKTKVRFNLPPANVSASPNVSGADMSNVCDDVNKDAGDVPTECDNYKWTGDSETKISESGTDESEFKELNHGDKIERFYVTGEREIIFQSGTRKVISADGESMKFFFYNGDVKEIFPDKSEIYSYANGAIETHFPDGLEETVFPNGQIQKRYPDGLKEIKFPDGTIHYMYTDGSEEIHAADGTIVTIGTDGTEIVEFANGQKEIRTSSFKRREFPDGSVKIIYESGRQETRYSNGRIRIKDKDGKLIVDTKYLGGHKVHTLST